MQSLAELVEQCATAAASTQPQDLPALAKLHTDLLAARLLTLDAKSSGPAAPAQFAPTAEKAALLVEKLILREVEDAQAAMLDLTQQINDLMAILRGQPVSQTAPDSG